MTILGVDPGTKRVGYGLVRLEGGSFRFLASGVLKIKNRPNPETLKEISVQLKALIKRWRPNVLGVERLYFVKNISSGLGVAEARGVIILAALEKGIRVVECSPNEVKSGLTGYGHTDKAGMIKMVRLTLGLPGLKLTPDAADALGIAIFVGRNLNRFRD